jgi:hypothetical protein
MVDACAYIYMASFRIQAAYLLTLKHGHHYFGALAVQGEKGYPVLYTITVSYSRLTP